MTVPLWIYQTAAILAQLGPLNDADQGGADPAAPANKPISFPDFQQGLRAYNNGETNNNYFRYGLIAMVLVMILAAVLLNIRQRKKDGQAPDSTRKLARELCRRIPFPFGARLLLSSVAKSAGVPTVNLLLSAAAFDRAVAEWSEKSTFTLVRRWGSRRLIQLRPILFD